MRVRGGKTPQLRKALKGWTEAKTERFLETLAESCNVTLAAESAEVSSTSVYRRRSQDATFRAAWGKAVATAVAALEMMLLKRALHGVERPVDIKNPEAGVLTRYDDRTALALLRMHRDTAVEADGDVDATEYQEAVERIMARLSRLQERITGTVETKGAVDRVATLKWLLAR
ncbi:MAG: hypothetical protein H0W65_08620 [Sphingomonas sp.]|uniref:hypothetical protein n=1 Tax=Sphingomonas sp. TaxID=28214 RepID=UPI0017C30BA2|nr:hypothetical protein [Sphingomonas sp.]MBA3667771.1 hypothetical protein [Sphingomonas sp.]